MRLTVLGCGTSGGTPLVGNLWGACDPNEPRNRRRRVSVLIEQGETVLLVDTSPDLREQLLDARVSRLDAVLWTHGHADHMSGLDDLRGINRLTGEPLDGWADAATHARLREAFGYAFEPFQRPVRFFHRPWLVAREITGPFRVGAIPVVPFRQDHGGGQATLGFRFGSVAYSTDVVELDEAAFAVLAGIEVWVVDCLREEPSPTHSHLARTLSWIERVKPRRAVLTHMNERLDYRSLAARLPPGVEPGFDGLVAEASDAELADWPVAA
jgi:phosphoribosyl 1,2-cyclic phosphate phosphodiesterase